ncbi:YlaI family protein [Bacillus vallismortis]|uniref:YlaI family protein n=1 Tax=Bacillus vallismortis TaxID=72361 RepID=UPI00209100F5|nr:YlaI family protein [Bacillus vallismortis]MCO4850971.1 YlaI family protein [Bacillus vallismortis]
MMRVKCSICDKIETIDDDTLIAKRLRNRPIHTYMCQECQDRITQKTEARLKTGKFNFHPGQQKKEKIKK